MSAQTHIIKRLVIELSLPSGKLEAFHMQNEIKSFCIEKINGELHRFFSDFISDHKIFRIQKLEVDLGRVTKQQFKEQLIEKIRLSIEDLLNNVQQKDITFHQEFSVHKEDYLTNISQQQKNEQLLFHFLVKGTFPWWAQKINWQDWEHQLISSSLKNNNSRIYQQVVPLLTQHPKALVRLVWQFSAAFLKAFINVISSNSNLNENITLFNFNRNVNKQAIQSFLKQWIDLEKQTNSDEKIESSIAILEQDQTKVFSKQNNTQENDIALLNKFAIPKSLKANQVVVGDNLSSSSLNNKISNLLPLPTSEGEYYIKNAGVAILLPGIPGLFNELGYLNIEKKFKNQKVQQRAIHLIQFLATSASQSGESEMVLNKLVCGWELDEPVKKNIKLTPHEKQSADDFLKDIIQQWGALKNTSPNGLRHNFLMRNGKLSFVKGHWLLQVEQASYDPFLLKKLPWTISIIKFRWMSERLHVEWVN